MLIILSPSKTLDYETAVPSSTATHPRLLKRSNELVDVLRGFSTAQLAELMSVNEKIAALNVERYQKWKRPFTAKNSRQALFAFKGELYNGLDVWSLTDKDLEYAQQHLRILSGLYGSLRPMDRMMPYRLEMATKLSVNRAVKNLYQFWGDTLTEQINADLVTDKKPVLINLASNEYYKAIRPKILNAKVITPVFKEFKNGKYKVLSVYAKQARGRMARYIIKKKLSNVQKIKDFSASDYVWNASLSTDSQWVFTRKQP